MLFAYYEKFCLLNEIPHEVDAVSKEQHVTQNEEDEKRRDGKIEHTARVAQDRASAYRGAKKGKIVVSYRQDKKRKKRVIGKGSRKVKREERAARTRHTAGRAIQAEIMHGAYDEITKGREAAKKEKERSESEEDHVR